MPHLQSLRNSLNVFLLNLENLSIRPVASWIWQMNRVSVHVHHVNVNRPACDQWNCLLKKRKSTECLPTMAKTSSRKVPICCSRGSIT